MELPLPVVPSPKFHETELMSQVKLLVKRIVIFVSVLVGDSENEAFGAGVAMVGAVVPPLLGCMDVVSCSVVGVCDSGWVDTVIGVVFSSSMDPPSASTESFATGEAPAELLC